MKAEEMTRLEFFEHVKSKAISYENRRFYKLMLCRHDLEIEEYEYEKKKYKKSIGHTKKEYLYLKDEEFDELKNTYLELFENCQELFLWFCKYQSIEVYHAFCNYNPELRLMPSATHGFDFELVYVDPNKYKVNKDTYGERIYIGVLYVKGND